MTIPARQSVWWVICCALFVCAPCHGEIRIDPGSKPDSETAALAQALRKELATQPQQAIAITTVTVGLPAFREALATSDGRPIVATYLTSADYYAALGNNKPPPNVTAIFSNPDPVDQLNLTESLLGKVAVGVFDSPGAHHLVTRLKSPAVQAIAAPPERGIDTLLQATSGLNAIIALPDSSVINRTNISHVVRALYQQRTVLIGYSQTLTRAGSLASVYVSSDAMFARIRVVSASVDATASGALPEPSFVRDVSIAVNEQLARSLNISVPASVDLLKMIRARRKDSSQ